MFLFMISIMIEGYLKTLYKFMLDNDAKEVIENDDYNVETNSYGLEVVE